MDTVSDFDYYDLFSKNNYFDPDSYTLRDYKAGWRDARNLAITLLNEKDDEIERLKERLDDIKKQC